MDLPAIAKQTAEIAELKWHIDSSTKAVFRSLLKFNWMRRTQTRVGRKLFTRYWKASSTRKINRNWLQFSNPKKRNRPFDCWLNYCKVSFSEAIWPSSLLSLCSLFYGHLFLLTVWTLHCFSIHSNYKTVLFQSRLNVFVRYFLFFHFLLNEETDCRFLLNASRAIGRYVTTLKSDFLD